MITTSTEEDNGCEAHEIEEVANDIEEVAIDDMAKAVNQMCMESSSLFQRLGQLQR